MRIACLSALGIAALLTVGLTGCAKQVKTGIYKDVASCTNDGFTLKECNAAFAYAKKTHRVFAPKYKTEADCEKTFGVGKCDQMAQSQGTVYFPFLFWYVVGVGNVHAQPVYQSQTGVFYSSGGRRLGSAAGRTTVSEDTVEEPTATSETVEEEGSESFHSSTEPEESFHEAPEEPVESFHVGGEE